MKKSILLIFALSLCAFGQVASLMPVPRIQFLDTNAHPLAGGLVYTYIGGTSTPAPTYTDSTATILNTNPVVLDSGGFASIWLGPIAYKIVVKNALGGSQYTVDNVSNNIAAGSINSSTYLLNGVNLADVAWTWTASQTFNGSVTFAGPTTFSGTASGVFSGSVNGALNVLNYGAKCDDATDDTAAFQLAINTAFRTGSTGYSVMVPATGKACKVTQLDLTNINNKIHLKGETSISGFQSTIRCVEATSNTKVCADFTGSQYVSLDNIGFYGGNSVADTPKVTVLLAKSDIGNSQVINWDNVTVEGYGDYQVYNAGGEIWQCLTCTFLELGTGGVDLVRLSSQNTAGVTSPFATIAAAPISMTEVALYGTFSAGGTAHAVGLDTGAFAVGPVTLGGFGSLGTATSFIHDIGTGELHGLHIAASPLPFRVEPTCTNCGLLTLANAVSDLQINAQWAAVSAPSVTLVNLAGQVNVGDIVLRPGDSQLVFPSVAVVTCSSTIFDLSIHDFIKTGGTAMTNACPGSSEIFFGTTAWIAKGTSALGTTLIASNACAATITVSAPGVVTTDVVRVGFATDPNAITGYGAGATGGLQVYGFPTVNNINIRVCNLTAGGITPAAISVNWRVDR